MRSGADNDVVEDVQQQPLLLLVLRAADEGHTVEEEDATLRVGLGQIQLAGQQLQHLLNGR